MVIRRGGIFRPLFRIAALTRSRLSRTEASGSPMTSSPGSPPVENTSTCTGNPATPLSPNVRIAAMFSIIHTPSFLLESIPDFQE